MADMINHPSHYNLPNRKECIDEMIDKYGIKAVESWCKITAYKYEYRAGHKDSYTQDMRKAIWYMNKARELHKKRKWEWLEVILTDFLPTFAREVFRLGAVAGVVHGILYSNQDSMTISYIFLALACVLNIAMRESKES